MTGEVAPIFPTAHSAGVESTRRQLRLTTFDRAVIEVRALIEEGVLPPGSHLDPVSLAAVLGVSRTPVREALVALRAEGVVELHDDARIRVPREVLDPTGDQIDLLAGVYGIAASRVATRASGSDLDDLLALAESLGSTHGGCRDPRQWSAFLDQLHVAGSSCSLRRAASVLHGQLPVRRLVAALARSEQVWRPMTGLIGAFGNRDPEGSRDHCTAVISAAGPALLQATVEAGATR